jgi:hypothetical protein
MFRETSFGTGEALFGFLWIYQGLGNSETIHFFIF